LALVVAASYCGALWLVVPTPKPLKSVFCVVIIMFTIVVYVRYGDPLIKTQPDAFTALGRIEALFRDLPDAVATKVNQTQPGSLATNPPAVGKTAPQPSLDLALTLIATIHKMRDPGGRGFMNGGQNDLIGVLRARLHNGVVKRHVRSLQVVGDVPADCRD